METEKKWDEARARLRVRHRATFADTVCVDCDVAWPCDVILVLEALDEARREHNYFRVRAYRHFEKPQHAHSTACLIWGDDGQGTTVEGWTSLPCTCGHLLAFVTAERDRLLGEYNALGCEKERLARNAIAAENAKRIDQSLEVGRLEAKLLETTTKLEGEIAHLMVERDEARRERDSAKQETAMLKIAWKYDTDRLVECTEERDRLAQRVAQADAAVEIWQRDANERAQRVAELERALIDIRDDNGGKTWRISASECRLVAGKALAGEYDADR